MVLHRPIECTPFIVHLNHFRQADLWGTNLQARESVPPVTQPVPTARPLPGTDHATLPYDPSRASVRRHRNDIFIRTTVWQRVRPSAHGFHSCFEQQRYFAPEGTRN
jgi:hypothetical protein